MADHVSLRGITLIRYLALHLPEFRGRNLLLYNLASLFNRQWPKRAFYTSPFGLHYELDLTDRGGYRQFYLFGRVESDLTWIIEHMVQKGDVVIEAGTGVGVYTTHIARRVTPTGWVHGFEPLDAAFAATLHHIRINSLQNVSLNKSALGAEEGKGTIYEFGNLPQGHASLSNLWPVESVGSPCAVTTIDDYVKTKQVDRVSFIKLDVEGSELLALRGGYQTIADKRPLVTVEANFDTSRAFGYEPADIISWFSDLSYACYVLRGTNWVEISSGKDPKHGDNILFVSENDERALGIINASRMRR